MRNLTLIVLISVGISGSACERRADTNGHNQVSVPSSGETLPTPITIIVDAEGYHPSSAQAPAGRPARLVFTRTSDAGCGQQLVFPTLGIRKDLPLNQAIAVNITMPASGSVAFTCGMNMYRGAVVVQ